MPTKSQYLHDERRNLAHPKLNYHPLDNDNSNSNCIDICLIDPIPSISGPPYQGVRGISISTDDDAAKIQEYRVQH
jgi:hypothetical protein